MSAVQSGNWSGPVGSAQAQQPFRDGLVVREQQPESRGFVPLYGRVEVRGPQPGGGGVVLAFFADPDGNPLYLAEESR